MASFANDTASSSDSSHVRYYFTYGSNMHLQQMAQRCEESILYSKGRLEGYKWQVNSRGGANIVEGDGADFVEGLIFTVSSRDLDSLRRHEKISEGYFVEKEIDINIEKLSILHFEKQKTTRIADEMAYYQARIKTGGPLGSWNAILKKEASTQKHTCMFYEIFYATLILVLTCLKLKRM